MFYAQNISIYMNFGGYRGGTYSTVHFLFIIQKNGKSTRAWPILKSNYTSFWFFFPRMNSKNVKNRGPQGAPLLFLYEVSIVVLIYFIEIILTSGIFLIQIVDTNNANMYLIRFHSKNIIKMNFPKSWVFKVKNRFRHSLYIAARWNIGFSKDLPKTYRSQIFLKIFILYIYIK